MDSPEKFRLENDREAFHVLNALMAYKFGDPHGLDRLASPILAGVIERLDSWIATYARAALREVRTTRNLSEEDWAWNTLVEASGANYDEVFGSDGGELLDAMFRPLRPDDEMISKLRYATGIVAKHGPGAIRFPLPDWFRCPVEFARVRELGIEKLPPWIVYSDHGIREGRRGLHRRYPVRDLIPFALRVESDDVTCWERGRGERVVTVKAFGPPADEPGREYDDFRAWFDEALDGAIAGKRSRR